LSWVVNSYDSFLSRFEHDKPHHLTDSNCLHHSKPCSNHSIKSHHSHLTSRWMEDQHYQHSTQVKLNIIKMERLVRRLNSMSNSTSKWSRVTCLALPLAAAQSLGSQVLEDSQSHWRQTIATGNKQLQPNK
jgi:hypothetical protein